MRPGEEEVATHLDREDGSGGSRGGVIDGDGLGAHYKSQRHPRVAARGGEVDSGGRCRH